MRDLNFAIKSVCHRNRDGSFSTRANRERMLDLCATQIREMGFRHVKKPDDLQRKHIHKLVEHWQKNDISTGSIKNRMAALRWLAEKVGQPDLVARSNDHYGIEHRQYVTNESRAVHFDTTRIDQIADRHVQASARLQREFGLRREEAMKCMPSRADQGDKIVLQASWCKGSREREVPIRTESQRAALDHAHQVAGKISLIPGNKSYIQHVRTFERQMAAVGLSKTHGARHYYAQQRYQELTGRACPALGGKTSKQLTADEKAQDRAVRLQISSELGHSREAITAVYIGR